MSNVAINIAAEFTGKKAFDKAKKSTTSLEKSVKSLGRTLGVALSAAAIVAYGKASVKAFADDQKSVALLANALKNLGLEFESVRVSDFISNLEKTSGIVDDQLRPALQGLLTTTGSITYAQKLLAQAIDISKGSSVDLLTVTQDLANAYNGNTKGLKKYFTGLTNAQFAAMSFDEIMAKLNSQFSGASAAYLDTYAGKMSIITVAADRAKETIGKGLLDAFTILAGGGGDSLQKLIDGIDRVSTGIANVIVGAAYYIKKLFDNPIVQQLLKAAYWLATHTGALSAVKRASDKGAALAAPKKAQEALTKKQLDLLAKQEAIAAAKAGKLKAATTKAQAAKDLASKKAGTVFDLEQIQIVAALKGRLSDDDKMRLEAQLALLNGNTDVATKLTNQILLAQDSTGNLSKFLSSLPNAKNPFEYLDAYLSYLANKAAAVLTGTNAPSAPSSTAAAAPMPTPSQMAASGSFGDLVAQGAGASGGFSSVVAAAMQAPVINVTVQGNVIREQELINQVLAGAQLSSLSGSPSQIGRIAGMFS